MDWWVCLVPGKEPAEMGGARMDCAFPGTETAIGPWLERWESKWSLARLLQMAIWSEEIPAVGMETLAASQKALV